MADSKPVEHLLGPSSECPACIVERRELCVVKNGRDLRSGKRDFHEC